MPTYGTSPSPSSQFVRYGEQRLWFRRHLTGSHTRFFHVPLGQAIVGPDGRSQALTVADTNLREGGRTPSGLGYDVTSVTVSLYGPDEDVLRVGEASVWSWDFTQTEIQGAHLLGADSTRKRGSGPAQCPLCSAPVEAFECSVCSWATRPYMTTSETHTYSKHPISIPGNCTWGIAVRSSDPDNRSVRAMFTLDGYYRNVVEIG